MDRIISMLSNPIMSIVLLCLILLLLTAIGVLVVLHIKRAKELYITKQAYETLNETNKAANAIMNKLLATGNALYELSEQSNVDVLTRMGQLQKILLEKFPWGRNMSQKMILSNIFSGLNKEAISSEDVSKLRLLQEKINSFRTSLKRYTYPLKEMQEKELRSLYLQLSMQVFDMLDSMAERPYYYDNQQGMNVRILCEQNEEIKPHQVTTLEDNQEKWALIMKGFLDGINKNEKTPLIYCGYQF